MEFVKTIILGIIQGATEFIPVSSSGHLILARDILNEQIIHGLAFDAVLQLATTCAVLVYFRKDILGYMYTAYMLLQGKFVEQQQKTLLYAVIIGTVPAVIFGLLLEDAMSTFFRSPVLVAGSLIVGGLIMLLAEHKGKQQDTLSVRKGLGIGFFQSLALIPGFSRSGMTISGGLLLGLTRIEATRFAFLLAVPVLFGSGVKKIIDLYTDGILTIVLEPLLVGFIASFLVGLAAIHFLIIYLQKHTLKIFVWYRFILAALILVIFL